MTDTEPNAYKLMSVVMRVRATLDGLRETDGQVIETEDELRAALADEGVDLDTVLAQIGRAMLDAAAHAEATSSRIDALSGRRDRATRRVEALRDTLLWALQAVGLDRFRDTDFSASWRPGNPRVVVTDAGELPGHMVTSKSVLTPDRDKIRAALVAGKDVPGAHLSNAAPILTMRVK